MTDRISVIIPTLGNNHILKTIEKLNRNSIKPYEIVLCIPDMLSHKVSNISGSNIKILKTKKIGQVYQRIEGFKHAKSNYVIQLDDDIWLDDDCIKVLLKKIKELDGKNAISPSLLNKVSKKSVYKKNKRNFFINLFYRIINGTRAYKPGSITKAGTCIGIDIEKYSEELIKTEWLPGGCILHKKNDLILENYFPFEGKAYSEDLIHSYYLSKNNVNFYIAKKAKCYIDLEEQLYTLTFYQFYRWLKNDFKARKYFLSLFSKNFLLLYFYYFKEITSFLVNKSFRWMINK